jgi:hypothetical protein
MDFQEARVAVRERDDGRRFGLRVAVARGRATSRAFIARTTVTGIARHAQAAA